MLHLHEEPVQEHDAVRINSLEKNPLPGINQANSLLIMRLCSTPVLLWKYDHLSQLRNKLTKELPIHVHNSTLKNEN